MGLELGEIVTRIWQGIYIPQKDVLMDLNGDGENDLYVSDKTYSGTKDANATYVTVGGATDIQYLDETNHLVHGKLQGRVWEDKMYLRPIPQSAILVNENLKQNPGWEL